MLKILRVSSPSDLRSTTLREREERGHCAKSQDFVASLDTEEVGFLSCEDWTARKPGFIYEIFVLPPFRRRGIGSSLLSFAENYALTLGCKSIRLKPHSLDHELAQSRLIVWYKSAGCGHTLDDPEHMEKKLHAQSAHIFNDFL